MVGIKGSDIYKADGGRTANIHTVGILESKDLKERQYLKR